MKKIGLSALFAILFATLLPALAFGGCTEDMFQQKERQQLQSRFDVLKGMGLSKAFVEKAAEKIGSLNWHEYRDRQLADPDRPAALERMCNMADELTVMAEDMMAGGDGSGMASPWQEHTPEDVYRLKLEFDRLYEDCRSRPACKKDDVGVIGMSFIEVQRALESGEITPGEFMDRCHALYERMLEKLRE